MGKAFCFSSYFIPFETANFVPFESKNILANLVKCSSASFKLLLTGLQINKNDKLTEERKVI